MTGQWKLAPREPSEEMMREGLSRKGTRNTWAAMHDAAPSVPEDVLERMARAFLTKLYGAYPDDQWATAHAEASVKAMRAALSAAQHSTQGEG